MIAGQVVERYFLGNIAGYRVACADDAVLQVQGAPWLTFEVGDPGLVPLRCRQGVADPWLNAPRSCPPSAAPRRSWRINPTVFLVAPTLAFLVVFLLLPYLNMVVMSLRTPSTRQVFAPGFTADNYLNALLDPDFYYLRILWAHHGAGRHDHRDLPGAGLSGGLPPGALALALQRHPLRLRPLAPCWWAWWCAATAGSSSSPTTRG